MALTFHGGDLAVATETFGVPERGWLDLSTGINPHAYPAALDAQVLRSLPERTQLLRLRAAAAQAYGMDSVDGIVAAPGTQALIQWLPVLRARGRVAVLSPTYGEHAPAWRAHGHEVVEVGDLPDAADVDVAVVTCPNNPDGRVVARDDLVALARGLSAKGGLLVVDEAFADTGPDVSIAAAADTGVVALRSFGKFYGLPGLRLGFALSDPATAGVVAAALGPWPVSTLAAEIGAAALTDADWQRDMRETLLASADRLGALLAGAGFELLGGTALFRLASHDRAGEIFGRLGRAGVYVRHFPGRPAWLRFGLPGTAEDWARLQDALAA